MVFSTVSGGNRRQQCGNENCHAAKKARMDDIGRAASRFSMRRKRIQTGRSSDADSKAASSE
jgi:hypothetical protein